MLENLFGTNIPKIAFFVEEIPAATGIDRIDVHRAIHDGKLRALKAGGRTIVRTEDLHAFLTKLPELK